MQILNPQPGLLPYPGADIGPGINQIGDTVLQFAMLKKQIEDDKAKRKLEMYLKTGEITGEIEAATPEIQKAFKKLYGIEPPEIFQKGGKTLAGRKGEAEIKNVEAETLRKESMAEWYKKRGLTDKNTPVKALDYAVKYANAKLGKPFEVLDDNERGLWQQFHDEGMAEWFATSKAGQQTETKETKEEVIPHGTKKTNYNPDQLNFINSWKSLPKQDLNKIVDPSYQRRLGKTLKKYGLVMEDLQ